MLVVTAPGTGGEKLAAWAAERWKSARSDCRFKAWSVQAVFEELAACDAVVIPSNPFDPRKAVKSPNRFTEALWAGRFVAAHALPAYEPLAPYGWVGEDLAEGLRALLADPADALARVRRGQDIVAEQFSPEVVGQAWKAAILATLSG